MSLWAPRARLEDLMMATPTDPDEVDHVLALSRAEPEVLAQLEAAVGRLRASREAKAALAGLDPATLPGGAGPAPAPSPRE
ncbi:hypothetical protein [Ornithinimicrobium murale]|uniref:hypothetical protein n=1 Tax=Ornithinimicrobium murale TaxID=1050153 RepID=UPI0013B437A6|nr:hypothetical protein [Ornithinimicrobium murale]